MSDATLDMVRLRCRAPTALTREALALRARLATTAHMHLPGALERALDDRGGRRVFVDRLEVALDFDPDEYDDVTVAALWAGRVARALAELEAGAPGVRVFADDRAFIASALASVLERGSLDATFAELGAGVGSVDPLRFLGAFADRSRLATLLDVLVADDNLAGLLYTRVGSQGRRALAAALRGERPWRALSQATGIAQDVTTAAEPPPAEPEGGRVRSAGAIDGRAQTGDVAAAPEPATPVNDRDPAADGLTLSPSAWHTAIARAAGERAAHVDFSIGAAGEPAHAASVAGDATPRVQGGAPADLAKPRGPGSRSPVPKTLNTPDADATPESWFSTSGGLVLLYPWLPDFLAGPLPRPLPAFPNPAIAARRWALAALVDDDAASLLDDPVVRVLAGDDPSVRRPTVATTIAERPAGFDAAAAHVLTSFARSLPGFEDSSPDYLRRWFLRREALVEPVTEGVVRISLEPGPLDLLLDRLPYPLSAVRLPWTPYLIIERRRPSAQPA